MRIGIRHWESKTFHCFYVRNNIWLTDLERLMEDRDV